MRGLTDCIAHDSLLNNFGKKTTLFWKPLIKLYELNLCTTNDTENVSHKNCIKFINFDTPGSQLIKKDYQKLNIKQEANTLRRNSALNL